MSQADTLSALYTELRQYMGPKESLLAAGSLMRLYNL